MTSVSLRPNKRTVGDRGSMSASLSSGETSVCSLQYCHRPGGGAIPFLPTSVWSHGGPRRATERAGEREGESTGSETSHDFTAQSGLTRETQPQFSLLRQIKSREWRFRKWFTRSRIYDRALEGSFK